MDIEAFIAEILARPAIWKSGHPQHKFKNVIKKSWEEIKQRFPDSEVEDLKKKWKNLRDAYSKELKKIPKLGYASYEPSWKYFQLLGFMKDEFRPPPADSTIDGDASNSVNENDDTSLDDFGAASSPAAPLSPAQTPILIDPTTSRGQDSTKKRQNAADLRAEYLEIEKKKLKLLEEEIARQHDNEREERKSDDYHFLMSILPEMEKLPPIQKMRLRNKINQALSDEITIFNYGEPYRRNENSTQPSEITNIKSEYE